VRATGSANYSAYRVLHLKHHHHLGQEGDPDHYATYTSWTGLSPHALGRLIVGYPLYRGDPILGYRRELPGSPLDRFRGLPAGLSDSGGDLFRPMALVASRLVDPMLVINTLVNIRGMTSTRSSNTIRHSARDPLHPDNRVTAFFMCNENYHLEHHLYPVSHGIIFLVHRALREDLTAAGLLLFVVLCLCVRVRGEKPAPKSLGKANPRE